MVSSLACLPEIETDRLVLRIPSECDFEPLADMYADEETMAFLGGKVAPDVSWRTLATFIGHWSLLGYGLFSVIEKHSDEFVGRVGLINPPNWPAMEIGWAIRRSSWGLGYATESARAVLNHEIARLRPNRLISLVDKCNKQSERVALKLGAQNCGTTEFLGSPTSVFAYSLPGFPLKSHG